MSFLKPAGVMARIVFALAAVASRDASAGDLALGQYLAGGCVSCHRPDGQDKAIPAISGWPVDQFVAALRSYRNKERPHVVMQTIAGRLADDEIAALAMYYGSLTANK